MFSSIKKGLSLASLKKAAEEGDPIALTRAFARMHDFDGIDESLILKLQSLFAKVESNELSLEEVAASEEAAELIEELSKFNKEPVDLSEIFVQGERISNPISGFYHNDHGFIPLSDLVQGYANPQITQFYYGEDISFNK